MKKKDFKKKRANKINKEIRASQIRLVGDNVENGIYSFQEAIVKSKELEVDLVEINFQNGISICKLVDYNKFVYDKNKKQKKQKKNETKEIRFRPTTDEGDYLFKKNNIENFLKKGKKVKTYVMFKGREMKFKQQGEKLLLRLAVDLEEVGIPESVPKMEGYRMNMMFKPKKVVK